MKYDDSRQEAFTKPWPYDSDAWILLYIGHSRQEALLTVWLGCRAAVGSSATSRCRGVPLGFAIHDIRRPISILTSLSFKLPNRSKISYLLYFLSGVSSSRPDWPRDSYFWGILVNASPRSSYWATLYIHKIRRFYLAVNLTLSGRGIHYFTQPPPPRGLSPIEVKLLKWARVTDNTRRMAISLNCKHVFASVSSQSRLVVVVPCSGVRRPGASWCNAEPQITSPLYFRNSFS